MINAKRGNFSNFYECYWPSYAEKPVRLDILPFTRRDYERMRRKLQKVIDWSYPVSQGKHLVETRHRGRLLWKVRLALRELQEWERRLSQKADKHVSETRIA